MSEILVYAEITEKVSLLPVLNLSLQLKASVRFPESPSPFLLPMTRPLLIQML